jgi:hypothetical protein
VAGRGDAHGRLRHDRRCPLRRRPHDALKGSAGKNTTATISQGCVVEAEVKISGRSISVPGVLASVPKERLIRAVWMGVRADAISAECGGAGRAPCRAAQWLGA